MTVVTLLFPSGCGFKDIDKRFFAVTIGIDKAEDANQRFKVEVKLVIPSPEEKFGSNQFLIVTQEADTITEAVRMIKAKIDKELDFGHAKAIIIGEKLLNEGNIPLDELMDWPLRRRDIQKISWMAIGKPDAFTILNSRPKSERLPSNQIFLFFGETGTETAYVVSEYLFDFYRRMKERGLDPILPVIEGREDGQFLTNRVTVFNKEKSVLTLTPLETKIFNSFYHNIAKSAIPVQTDDVYAAIDAREIRTSYWIDNTKSYKPTAMVQVKVIGVIEESKKHIHISDLPMYERATEQILKVRITALLKKLQKAGVDPIGFGLRYRATHRTEDQDWKEWQTVKYPNLEFQVTTHVSLRGAGVIEN